MRKMALLLILVSFTKIASLEFEVDHQDIFAYGPTGVSGNYTTMMKLIIAYSKNRDAENDFYMLTTMHNANIQLYGLVGLKIVGSKRFEECKALMLKSEDSVLYGNGCRVNKDSVKNIVNDIANSKVTDFLRKEDVPNESVKPSP